VSHEKKCRCLSCEPPDKAIKRRDEKRKKWQAAMGEKNKKTFDEYFTLPSGPSGWAAAKRRYDWIK
jgi:hypothetical protein